MGRPGFGNQCIQFRIVVFATTGMLFSQLYQPTAIAFKQFPTIGRAAPKGIQAAVEPAHQRMLGCTRERAGVDEDVVLLADAVEPPDALLQQVRIQRQIPKHEVMRELEIAPLRADLGTQQQACAFHFGEIGGIAVALKQAHAFVKACDLYPTAHAQHVFEREYLGLAATDQQEFLVGELFDHAEQPGQARIACIGKFDLGSGGLQVRMEFREQVLALGIIQFAAIQGDQLRNTTREAANLGAAISEHDPPGAMAIDQCVKQGVCRSGIHWTRQQMGQWLVFAETECQFLAIIDRQGLAIVESAGDLRERRIAFGFRNVTVEIMVTGRIEQAQASEVPAASELLGCRSQQDKSRRPRGQ